MAHVPNHITVKLDLYGTTQTTGIKGARYDRATRLCLVEGLPDDTNGLVGHSNIDTAIKEVRLIVGLSHHKITNLPLQSATGRKFGPNTVWVSLRYARGRFQGLTGDGGTILLQSRTEWESTPVYRNTTNDAGEVADFFHGLPGGYMLGNPDIEVLQDPKKRPPYMMWKRPVEKIFVHTLLSSHPSATVAPYIGRINELPVTMGAVNFAAYTLRYDGADVDVDENSDGGQPFYDTLYAYTAIDTGHYHQFPVWFVDGVGQGTWIADDELMHEAKNFTGVFPYGS